METFVRGEVVSVYYPFADQPQQPAFKQRPAIIIASWPFANSVDYLLCMISSQMHLDPYLVTIGNQDFSSGSLDRPSYARCNYLSTVNAHHIHRRLGRLTPEKFQEVLESIAALLTP